MKTLSMKKALSAILALSMLASLSGCISKPESNKEPQSKAPASTGGTSSVETEKIDPLGKYDPPITLTSVRDINASFAFPEGDDIENNSFTRAVYDRLGIKIKYDWVVDTTQLKTKTATMLASNSMPDYFLADPANFAKLAEGDAVMEISDMYSKYAGDALKSEDAGFKQGFDSSFRSGKQYGIAHLGWGTISLPQLLWMRSDWLEKSGMEAPKTIDELDALAKKFMADNKGTYGLAMHRESASASASSSIVPLANAYHAYLKQWIKDESGQIVYGSIQPEMKNTLLKLQDMYKTGVISKEFSVKDLNKVNEDIVSGKVGILLGGQWMGGAPLQDALKNDPNAIWKPYPVPTTDDNPVYLQGDWPVGGYYVINKKCKNPEAVVKMINLYFDLDSDGTFGKIQYGDKLEWTTYPAYQTMPNREYDTQIAISNAITTGDESKLNLKQKERYDVAKKWIDNKDPLGFGVFIQMGPEGSYSILKKYVDDDKVLLNEIKGAIPDGYAAVKSTLETLEDDTFTKIIMGADISEFDKFVETWNKIGGEAATKEVNETFNK